MTPGDGRRRRTTIWPVAALLVAIALLVACSDPTGHPPAPGPPAGPLVGAAASSSRAAELEAGLTSALVERVYATAAARTAATQDRPTSVGGTLDRGSQALAELLGAYDKTSAPLASALRQVDGLQVMDARAAGTPDAAAVRTRLVQAQRDLAAGVRRAVPSLSFEQILDRLLPDLDAQLAAAGAAPYDGLHIASLRARETARVLAAAVAETRRLGPAGTRAAALRADLTGLLTEHVLLTGALAGELGDGGRLAAGAASARGALEANTRSLTEVIGVSYPAAAAPFGAAWSRHVTQLEARAAEEAAAGVPGPREQGAQAELARLFAAPVAGLPVDRLAAELTPLLDAQVQAMATAARRAPEAAADLRVTVGRVPVPAALVAAGIAQHLRLS